MYVTAPIRGDLRHRLVVAGRDGSHNLRTRAAAQYHAALSRLPWTAAHLDVVGLFDDGGALVASAERYLVGATLDGASVRLCLLGAIAGDASDERPARLLVERLLVLSVVGTRWIIEACGDLDPSGARVGAILQALIAAEPSRRRPVIRGWWPAAATPPQVAVVATEASADRLWVQWLAGQAAAAPLRANDVMLWHGDLP